MRHGLVEQRGRAVGFGAPCQENVIGRGGTQRIHSFKKTKRRRAGKSTRTPAFGGVAARRSGDLHMWSARCSNVSLRQLLLNVNWTADDASLERNDLDCFFLHCVSPLCFEGRLAPHLVKAKNQGEFCGRLIKNPPWPCGAAWPCGPLRAPCQENVIGRGGTQIIHSFKKTKRRRARKKHPHSSVGWCCTTAIRRSSPVVCEMLHRQPAATRFLYNRNHTADDASLQRDGLDSFFLHVFLLCDLRNVLPLIW